MECGNFKHVTFGLPFLSFPTLETMIFWPQMKTNDKYKFNHSQTCTTVINNRNILLVLLLLVTELELLSPTSTILLLITIQLYIIIDMEL